MAINWSKLGEIAAGAAKGRADGRLAEANYGISRDAVAGRNAATNVDLDSTRIKQAIMLSMLGPGGVQDAQVTPPAHIAARMPTMTGGLRPSAIPGREQIYSAAYPRIMESLFKGEHMPAMTPTPEEGKWGKALSMIGEGAGLYSSFGGKAGTVAAALGKGAGVAGGGAAGGAAALGAGGLSVSAAPLASLGIGTSSALGAAGTVAGGTAAGAAGGGSGAAAAGGGVGIGAAGAATLGVGLVGAALIAWQKNRNSTKNARDDFAKSAGLRNTETLYAKLASLGPEGQKLAHIGMGVIGKKDQAANKQWMTQVGAFLDKASPRPQFDRQQRGFGRFA
jgi:hypothetical protein